MAILLDTNILVRLANVADAQHLVALNAVIETHRRGELLHITPQVLIEFRSVATRPKSANGAGLSIADAEAHAAAFESKFPLLPDTPAIFALWKSIVSTLGISSKQVHDARLMAVCHAHAVGHLMTFDTAHFQRMTSFGSGVKLIDPATV